MSDSEFDEESKSGLHFALRLSLRRLEAKNRLKTHVFHSGTKTKLATENLTPPQDSAHSTYPPTQLSTKSVTKSLTVIFYSRLFNLVKFSKCREKDSRFPRGGGLSLQLGEILLSVVKKIADFTATPITTSIIRENFLPPKGLTL